MLAITKPYVGPPLPTSRTTLATAKALRAVPAGGFLGPCAAPKGMRFPQSASCKRIGSYVTYGGCRVQTYMIL